MCLAALFAIGISELGFQRGDTFIAGAVIFVVFMVGVFIFFPVWEIFRNVLFDKADAFVPFQFFRIMQKRNDITLRRHKDIDLIFMFCKNILRRCHGFVGRPAFM